MSLECPYAKLDLSVPVSKRYTCLVTGQQCDSRAGLNCPDDLKSRNECAQKSTAPWINNIPQGERSLEDPLLNTNNENSN